MSERFKKSTAVAAIVRVPRSQLALIEDRHEEIRRDEHESSLEPRRCDTNDREGVLVEPHRAAHNVPIVLKTAMPVCVGKHHVGSAVGAVLI